MLGTKVGGLFSPLRLDEDLRAVWKMGYFDDVRVETNDSPKGKVVTFIVKEKPTVREVKITGNKAITDKDIRDQVGLKPFGVYQPRTIKQAESKIVKLYHDKGYYDVKVRSEVIDLPSGGQRSEDQHRGRQKDIHQADQLPRQQGIHSQAAARPDEHQGRRLAFLGSPTTISLTAANWSRTGKS